MHGSLLRHHDSTLLVLAAEEEARLSVRRIVGARNFIGIHPRNAAREVCRLVQIATEHRRVLRSRLFVHAVGAIVGEDV